MNTTLPPRFRRRRESRFAALVRNDRDGLEVRHFATAADATAVSRDRELPTPAEIASVIGKRSGMTRHTVFAKELGVTPRMVRRVYQRGGLPGAVEQSAYILDIPTHLLRLALAWGLRQVERMAKAGLLNGGTQP